MEVETGWLTATEPAPVPYERGDRVDDFALSTLDGGEGRLSDYHG